MKFFTEDEIEKIRHGFFSAVYFIRTQQILLEEQNFKPVTMQIFQKQDATICGVEEVIELFQQCAGYFNEKEEWVSGFNDLSIQAVPDGTDVKPWETIMHITGPYVYFAHLESVYLGILARRTKIATSSKKVASAANGKQIIFFADRFDSYLNQEGDGYGAKVGGINSVATPAQAFLSESQAMGTIPHSLIAINNGNTLQAAESFVKRYPQTPLIVLADFENDCVKTALEVARVFGDKLYGVRLDTSEKLIDKSLQSNQSVPESSSGQALSESEGTYRMVHPEGSQSIGVIPAKAGIQERTGSPIKSGMTMEESQDNNANLHGVNKELVKKVREALDNEGFSKVKIIVSGGFTAEKIAAFEQNHIPVDIYGVGSSLLKNQIDFTADIVKVNGQEIAKAGRKFQPNEKLQVIDKI